jgi:type II secretory pathway pseudopilin PulG
MKYVKLVSNNTHLSYNRRENCRHLVKGFSLVELMIGMALGVFIIGGLISVFISSSQNYRIQQGLTEVGEKGRYAIKVLRDDIQNAGFDLASDVIAFKEIGSGLGTCITTPGKRIFEVYWGEEIEVPGELPTVNEFRHCYFIDDQFSLARIKVDGPPGTAPTAAPVIIIPRVLSLDLSYGVDVDINDGIDTVNNKTYLKADDLIDGTPTTPLSTPTWLRVEAVKVELIVASDTERVTQSPQLLKQPFGAGDLQMLDMRLYQAYSAVLTLRNRFK